MIPIPCSRQTKPAAATAPTPIVESSSDRAFWRFQPASGANHGTAAHAPIVRIAVTRCWTSKRLRWVAVATPSVMRTAATARQRALPRRLHATAAANAQLPAEEPASRTATSRAASVDPAAVASRSVSSVNRLVAESVPKKTNTVRREPRRHSASGRNASRSQTIDQIQPGRVWIRTTILGGTP